MQASPNTKMSSVWYKIFLDSTSRVFTYLWNLSGWLILLLTSSSPGTSVGLALPPASRILPLGHPCRTSQIWSTPASLLISQTTTQVLRGVPSVYSYGFQNRGVCSSENCFTAEELIRKHLARLTICLNRFSHMHITVCYVFMMSSRWLVIFQLRQNQAPPLCVPLNRHHLFSPWNCQPEWCRVDMKLTNEI